MYQAPPGFPIPDEVHDYHKDQEKLGVICDMENWYVTPEWAQRFAVHAEKLLDLSVKGDPWAQYNLGNMYFIGVLYASEDDFYKNYQSDAEKGSYWLEKCARQGFVAAVDNLVVSGVGDEADRLRAISTEVEIHNPECIEYGDGIPTILPTHFEKVWKKAYGQFS